MRRSWLRRNRPLPPSRALIGRGRVVHFSAATGSDERPLLPTSKKQPAFLWKASERRPWAIKREDRPAAFAGRPEWVSSMHTGLPVVPTRASILSRALHASQGAEVRNPRNQPGSSVRRSRGKKVARYTGCGRGHLGRIWTRPGGAVERPPWASPSRGLSSATVA